MFALLAIHLTSTVQAVPVPQNPPGTNAPAGPSMTTSADLSASIGDLVIPQAEHSNNTASEVKMEREAAPPSLDEFLGDIGDFQMPSNVTARSIAQAAK